MILVLQKCNLISFKAVFEIPKSDSFFLKDQFSKHKHLFFILSTAADMIQVLHHIRNRKYMFTV